MSLTHNYVSGNEPAIICDTLVWYKNLSNEFVSQHRLAATWLSVIELFKSSDRKVGVILNLWKKLRDNSAYIIPLSPEQHYHFYLNKGEIINPEIFEIQKETVGRYDWIIEQKRKGNCSDELWDLFEAEAKRIKTDYDANIEEWIVDNINDFKQWERSQYLTKEEYIGMRSLKRAELTSPEGVERHLNRITMPRIISFFTNVPFKDVLEFDPDDFLQFELFTHVFNQWLIDVDIHDEKTNINDVIDLFNMIYVRPIDKYWTEETRWIKRIKNVGLEHYLFDPSNS